jgi:hypothetical protein
MKTAIQHVMKNEFQRNQGILQLTAAELPCTMTLKHYTHNRSNEQNALSHVWYQQIAATLREDTAEGVKCYCKLRLGIPILRGESDDFRERYDRTLKGLTYEQKIEIMIWFPVTSLMKVEQKSLYLEQIQQHYADRVQLLFPGEPL